MTTSLLALLGLGGAGFFIRAVLRAWAFGMMRRKFHENEKRLLELERRLLPEKGLPERWLLNQQRLRELKRLREEQRRLVLVLFQARRLRSEHFLLSIAVRLLPPSERDRYLEEFRAELLDLPRNTRLSHALSLLRGVFVLRLRRGLKNKATDAAVRRAKG